MDGIYLIVNQDTLSLAGLIMLCIALGAAFAFEFVNGFHDTANAVATVIYTKSLGPTPAVVTSGICNFFGVWAGGTGVAFTIVHLLPADLIANEDARHGLIMVMAILTGAIIWNFGTWFKGLPASSSHTLIGSIIGVGLADAVIRNVHFGSESTWNKISEVFLALLISPVIGFCAAALLLLGLKIWFKHEHLHSHPYSHIPDEILRELKDKHTVHARPPHFWIRLPTVLSSMAVSFAHGSNDGQKGMGLIMLILIGLLPANFALDKSISSQELDKIAVSLKAVGDMLAAKSGGEQNSNDKLQQKYGKNVNTFIDDSGLGPLLTVDCKPLIWNIGEAGKIIANVEHARKLTKKDTWELRTKILMIEESLSDLLLTKCLELSPGEAKSLNENRKVIRSFVEYVPAWIIFGVALALSCGTMIGWKRIVVTIGEKIGKSNMTYAQGLTAQIVAACTIGLGNMLHMPVSTTHVLSSAVAGTMVANKAGLQAKTVKDILLAWVFTFPASVALSAFIYLVSISLF